jgi:hypothetical protein
MRCPLRCDVMRYDAAVGGDLVSRLGYQAAPNVLGPFGKRQKKGKRRKGRWGTQKRTIPVNRLGPPVYGVGPGEQQIT